MNFTVEMMVYFKMNLILAFDYKNSINLLKFFKIN